MSDIYSWIDEAAESGRAVDYQDHLKAIEDVRRALRQSNEIWLMWQRTALEAQECIKAALTMMEGCERCGLSATGSGEDPLIERCRKAACLDTANAGLEPRGNRVGSEPLLADDRKGNA